MSEDIERRFSQMRRAAGWSVSDVADALGVPREDVEIFETGKLTLTAHHVMDATYQMGGSIDWVLWGEPSARYVGRHPSLRPTASSSPGRPHTLAEPEAAKKEDRSAA